MSSSSVRAHPVVAAPLPGAPAPVRALDGHFPDAHSLSNPSTHPMESRLQGHPADPSVLLPDEEPRAWFSKEVLPHESALRSWLRVRFPTLTDRDDIVQESYARLLKVERRERITNARSYLFSTARNLALDLFRRRRVAPIISTSEAMRSAVPEERIGVADAVSAAQEFEILRRAIDALPERCRTIMLLQKMQGLSNAAIAERLNLSVNTVNAQLVIGLARCRAYLAARGVLRGRKS